MTNATSRKTTVLTILDGWGHRDEYESNAIANAHTPNLDRLYKECPHTLISASGMDVGLPEGQMGNSEVGHTSIGAGRIVYQDLTRIQRDIELGGFFNNSALCDAIDKAVSSGKAVHIMGLLSPGGVHSHDDHILAAIQLAHQRGARAIYLHAFGDGRDTAPRSMAPSLQRAQDLFDSLQCGGVASLVGRYFAMDRDNNWDRVEKAYRLICQREALHHSLTPSEALESAYLRGENDEFIQPTTIGEAPAIQSGDALLFMNFRADRARQISRVFLPDFNDFVRAQSPCVHFVMLTEYAADIPFPCAYPPEALSDTLGEWLAKHHKTQLRISETEKYAHVTFFFNGGLETPFEGEERILINSPKVATYDLQPEMSSTQLTDALVAAIDSQKYDVIICNYPNGDMVGHTGVYEAAVKACEAIDRCIGRVVDAVQRNNAQMLITADHGNAEMMVNPVTGKIHTAHTLLPVPLIYVGEQTLHLQDKGQLSDLAPTLLTLMKMPIPKAMSGRVLTQIEA